MTPHARFIAAARLYGEPFGVTPEMLRSSCRLQLVVTIRWQLIIHCRHVFGWSLTKIGQRLGGRDHTTVLHALGQTPETIALRLARFNNAARLRKNLRERLRDGREWEAAAQDLLSRLSPPPTSPANDDRPALRRPITWEDALRRSADWRGRNLSEAA